ncbi:hypothetical protein UY3_12566 [Chelonia mydas]|uniref:Myb/SANT-like DNA-binding domain-containing protein n=1 Tax=Chelonia mydas TaxID=8469 RepID=M7BQC0_CHEMY|nr:hypothetical protein UY3_12566 [Chelonia mydas]
MMESQNRKRAPAWTERKVRDLIAVWGEESVLSELRSSFRNAKTFVKISQGMKDRGHNRDPKQCRMKLKELRQAYQKTREANGRSGSEPQTCRFYDELHAILGGSATTTPAVLFDSFNGDGGNTEAGFGDEEDDDDDDEVVDSPQQASGETGAPGRRGQEHLGHDEDRYPSYCNVCRQNGMGWSVTFEAAPENSLEACHTVCIREPLLCYSVHQETSPILYKTFIMGEEEERRHRTILRNGCNSQFQEGEDKFNIGMPA